MLKQIVCADNANGPGMKRFPTLPPLTEVGDEVLGSGHVWLLEYVDGEPICFQLEGSGMVRYSVENREAAEALDLPGRYRHAGYHIQDRIDRKALHTAVEDPSEITFCGIATQYRSVVYEWPSLPSFLGLEIWSDRHDDWYPPDIAHRIFAGIGLRPINPIEREVHPRDFDPGSYEIPKSAWYGGQSAGVIVRNKAGGRGVLEASRSNDTEEVHTMPETANMIVEEICSEPYLHQIVTDIEEGGGTVRPDRLIDRLVAAAWRVYHPAFQDSRNDIDESKIREAVAARMPELMSG